MTSQTGHLLRKIILLRAINAGVPLKMEALRGIAAGCGYANPRTYIASGNLLIDTDEDEATIRATLGAALEDHLLAEGASAPRLRSGQAPRLRSGRTEPWIFVRTADDLDAVLADNPFPHAPGNRAMVLFLDTPPTQADIDAAKHRTEEDIALGARHLYLHFPEGQGQSRLRLSAMERGTARNMNTVAKLAAMARG